MGLMIKNFDVFGVHWKIWFLGGYWKTNIEGGLPKKGGLRQFSDFRGQLGKKEGVFLKAVDTFNAHYELFLNG